MMLEREIAGSGVTSCKACGGELVITMDAIGRTRERCRRCDGVARRAPDPNAPPPFRQPTPTGVNGLPPVAPGQLRCQRCAKGVEKRNRFCAPCQQWGLRAGARKRLGTKMPVHPTPNYRPRPCRGCLETFTPTTANRYYCPICAADPVLAPDKRGRRKKKTG